MASIVAPQEKPRVSPDALVGHRDARHFDRVADRARFLLQVDFAVGLPRHAETPPLRRVRFNQDAVALVRVAGRGVVRAVREPTGDTVRTRPLAVGTHMQELPALGVAHVSVEVPLLQLGLFGGGGGVAVTLLACARDSHDAR